MLKNCEICNEIFKVKPSHYNIRKTCGKKKCKSINMSKKLKGKKKTTEHRGKLIAALFRTGKKRGIKISESLKNRPKSISHRLNMSIGGKGKKLTDIHKAKIGIGNKGKPNSQKQKTVASQTMLRIWEENREKMLESVRKGIANRPVLSGPKSHMWKGGISFEPYPIEFNRKLKKQIKERDSYQCQNPNCDRKNKILHIHHINYIKDQSSPLNLITLCRLCHSKTNFNRKYWMFFYFKIIIKKYDEIAITA